MEQITKTDSLAQNRYLLKGVDYETYKAIVGDALAQNKVTGLVQSEALLAYTKLNMFRMHRIEKTIQLLPEVKEIVEKISSPQTWLVLTEGWCGDAAQILPVLNTMAALNENINFKMLFRDENLELMDLYLTNGVSRSIPKLIVSNPATNEEFFNWGPRPLALQEQFQQMQSRGLAFDEIKEEVHRWYAKDRTYSTQKEISSLLAGTIA